jgi:hypothetical protein
VNDHVNRDGAEFGVLFVHGIGQQGPGRGVASFAAALYGWLFRWNCPEKMSSDKSPTLRHAVLPPELGEDPAHVTLAVPLDLSNGQQQDARWLLAESRWAKPFTPRFLDLAHWTWKVSTCLLVVQFVIPMHRHWRKTRPDAKCHVPVYKRLAHAPVVLGYALLIGLAAMSSVLVSILLLALAVAAMLPIPRIDLAVQWVVVKLAAVLGDSYVLAHCPVQFAAMRTQVARDLSWLQDRCDKVAVVAHSQGAAIAHQVLADLNANTGNLRAFITVGQGITQRHRLSRMDWDPDARQDALWTRLLVATGLMCAGLPALGAVASRWSDAALFAAVASFPADLILVASGLVSIALGVLRAIRAFDGKLVQDVYLPGAGTKFSWVDYYASADPVSNGPLPADANPGAAPVQAPLGGRIGRSSRCEEIYNSASILTDHNGYLHNQDQFLSWLVNDLVATANGDSLADPARLRLVPDEALGNVKKRRRRLVAWLVFGRTIVAGLGIVLWRFNPGRVLKGPMNHLLQPVPPHAQMNDGLARSVAVVLIVAAIYIVAVLIPWRIMEKRSTQRFFRRAKPRTQRAGAERTAHEPTGPSEGNGVGQGRQLADATRL